MVPNCPPWVDAETAAKLPSVVGGMIEFVRFIHKKARTHILQHGDIKTWHGKLFRDVVPLGYYAGHYRSDDPNRPCLRTPVYVDGLPGAPFVDVPRLMRDLSEEMRGLTTQTDKYIAREPTPTNRARAAIQLVAVYMGKLIQIHPFINGNGRMARLTANYFLHRYGYPMPFYDPYPRPNSDYADASAACMRGDFKRMYMYLLTLLGTQMSS